MASDSVPRYLSDVIRALAADWLNNLTGVHPSTSFDTFFNEPCSATQAGLMASEGVELEPGRIKPENWLNQDISVFHGYSSVATVNSYDDATESVRTLAELARLLPEEELIRAVVDAYYDLVDQRQRLSKNLSPVGVGKWIEDGSCDWCPAGN